MTQYKCCAMISLYEMDEIIKVLRIQSTIKHIRPKQQSRAVFDGTSNFFRKAITKVKVIHIIMNRLVVIVENIKSRHAQIERFI